MSKRFFTHSGKNVHPERDQLELLVFFVSFSSTFISPCSFVQLHPSSMPATQAQATNERTNGRTRRASAPPPISSAFGSALCFESRAERAERARSEGEGKNRLSTGPRFVESHLANSVNVVRRRRRRRRSRRSLLWPRSLAPPSRSRDKRASMLALESENERTAERRPDDGSSRQLLSGEATSNLTRGRERGKRLT